MVMLFQFYKWMSISLCSPCLCFRGHQGVVWCLCAYKGKLYSAGDDSVVKVWDLESLAKGCISNFQGHTGTVCNITKLSCLKICFHCLFKNFIIYKICFLSLLENKIVYKMCVHCLFINIFYFLIICKMFSLPFSKKHYV